MQKLLAVLVLASVLGIAGCGSKHPKPDTSASSDQSANGADTSGADAANAGQAGQDDETPGPQAGLLAKRVIYFDFDSSEIKGDGTDIVAAHAKYLASHASARVRLEGNTDERGSREYNIGLGERRAQAVRRALLLQGAAETQLSTVSYGEERPAVVGNDESAWSRNRRVEIVYLSASGAPGGGPQQPK
ncbi:MAG TPA: peptidoglycan-associated lipoprotein Pal [Steroidobacteraceae bacterium]|nr:peptidoglycan-associated lipoprotein Pal [Steroidobacteraceae bacterium]